MDAATKVARQRLSVLQLAEALGNTAEACRRRGMDRTSFFEWRRRFQTHALRVSRICRRSTNRPQTTAPETVARILDLALTHPSHGCNRLEAMLALEGVRLSAIPIQKLLNDHDLGSRYDRWLVLEKRNGETPIAPDRRAGRVSRKAEPVLSRASR